MGAIEVVQGGASQAEEERREGEVGQDVGGAAQSVHGEGLLKGMGMGVGFIVISLLGWICIALLYIY